ncbi:MAG: hypothetical protein K0U72_14740 [Gammaproteobacteria bacterium]|nr:hypothetical protein [Gammaproteobacteria bacterium]
MATFLQILLAVVLVIAGLIFAAWIWIKHRFKQVVGDITVANELIGTHLLQPARIQLYRSSHSEYGKDFDELRERLLQLGFHRMADFEDYAGAFQLLHATSHRDLPVAAAIIEDMSGAVTFVLFAMDGERNVRARGNGQKEDLVNARVDWCEDPELTPEAAFEDMRASVSEASLPMNLQLFRAIYEQIYALRMDQKLVHYPRRESIEALAADSPQAVSDEQIDSAYEMAVDNWNAQVEEAVLDRYRRKSKIDAVAWEELRDGIQVVHARIDNDLVASMLVIDTVSEQIFDQCVAQDLNGVELYKAVASRLPPDQQWKQIGQVDRPVRALLFSPNEDIVSDVPSARRYIYEAQDDDDNAIQGGVYAQNGADAKQQIAALGLRKAKLLIEPTSIADEVDELLIDDKVAAIAARSVKEGVLISIFRALLSNWWIWAIPAGLLTKSYLDGAPYSWGDYVVLAWAVLAALAMIFLIAPMFFYNQLLMAQLKAKPSHARFWIGLLSLTGRFAGITASQLTTERCKALAEEGKLDEALALRSADRAALTEEEYQSALVQIYGTAGEWSSLMDSQRAYLEVTPAKETATVDLAMSIARYSDDADGAESLIQSVSPADLPEIALIGFQYVRGLVASQRGQQQQALRHYAQAIETARQFETLPIMLGLIAEINGHAALAFKRGGNNERADSLWRQSWPILKLHRSSEMLISAFNKEQQT